ncbi:MAG TPA: hypothetical protein PLB48_06565 [Treponema sp.]|nr:hypothetical protein [Treponema sp.]HRS04613.1 hypothetical protein [Treponema sp.]HRU29072.1 hypothetical protein [Treponema sp.]
MEDAGYWYRNCKLFNIGVKKHINYIIEYPEYFGLTREYIEQVYASFNEKIGFEGKAREALIKQVSKDGWIRLRHYVRPKDYWSIQYDNYSLRKSDLKGLVDFLIKEHIMVTDDEIILLGYEDNSQFIYPYKERGASTFLEKNACIKYSNVTLIEDFSCFASEELAQNRVKQ